MTCPWNVVENVNIQLWRNLFWDAVLLPVFCLIQNLEGSTNVSTFTDHRLRTFYKCTIYWNIRTICTIFAFTGTNQARHLFLRNFSRVPRLSSRVEYDRYCICVILAVFTRAPRGSISVQARYAWQESAVWSLTGQYGRYLPSSRRWRTGEWRFVAGGIWNGRWWIKQRFVYLTRCHPKSRLIVRPSAHGHGKARSHTLLRLI